MYYTLVLRNLLNPRYQWHLPPVATSLTVPTIKEFYYQNQTDVLKDGSRYFWPCVWISGSIFCCLPLIAVQRTDVFIFNWPLLLWEKLSFAVSVNSTAGDLLLLASEHRPPLHIINICPPLTFVMCKYQ